MCVRLWSSPLEESWYSEKMETFLKCCELSGMENGSCSAGLVVPETGYVIYRCGREVLYLNSGV